MKNKIITKLINIVKIKRNKKALLLLFLLLVFGGGFLAVTSAHAIPSAADIGNAILDLISKLLLWLAGLCIRVALFAWDYFMELASYNDFMNAPPVTIGWIMMRDLANMFFIVALMIIAVGTVLGIEQYEWKKSLVKLIFAAIFINFSKLILQLVLDFAQVLMETFLIAFRGASGGHLVKMFSFNKMTELLSSGGSMEGVKSSNIFLGAVVALVMAMLVMFTIVSYLIVMIGRMIVLWMLMILSPLAFVLSAFPFGKQYASEFWKNFFNYAMVGPVMVFFTWLAFASLQTGDIATEININLNKLRESGQSGGTAFGEATISINAASTWENLASFFIALGFFMVGITMVQRMGVVGGQLTQKAMDFTKRAATIASGYALGRWMVDRGKQGILRGVGGVAGDYGRLAWGATGERLRHAKGIKSIPLLGAAGAAKRKAMVKRLEDIKAARETQYAQEGAGRWSPAGILGPKKAELVKQQVEAEKITEAKEMETKKMKANYLTGKYGKDMINFVENRTAIMRSELNVNLAENEKTKDSFEQLLVAKEKGDTDGMIEAMGNIDKALELDYTKQRDIDRKAARKSTSVSGIMEEIAAEEAEGSAKAAKDFITGKYTLAYTTKERNILEGKQKEIDTTMKGEKIEELVTERVKTYTPEERGDSTEEELREKARDEIINKELEGNIKVAIQKGWSDELNTKLKRQAETMAINTAKEEGVDFGSLLEESKKERVGIELREYTRKVDNAADYIRKEDYSDDEWKALSGEEQEREMLKFKHEANNDMTGRQTDIEKEYNDFAEKTKATVDSAAQRDSAQIILEKDMDKEKGKGSWAALSKADKDKEIETYLKNPVNETAANEKTKERALETIAVRAIKPQEQALRYKKEGIFKDLVRMGGVYETAQAQRGINKTKSEMERVGARIQDFGRMEEGKRAQVERAYEIRRSREEFEEYSSYTFDELNTEIANNHKIISDLKKKVKDVGKGDWKNLSKSDQDALKNYTQNQARAIASFTSQFSGVLPNVIAGLDKTYKGKNLGDPKELHKAIMGLVSGEDYETVDKDFGNIQENVRTYMKEKASPIFRSMQLGMEAAVRNGDGERYYDQMRFGVNSAGQKVMGFTNAFNTGLGAGDNLGTGKIDKAGQQVRQTGVKEMVSPYLNLRTIKDGRFLVSTDDNGKALGAISDEAEAVILRLATESKNQINTFGPILKAMLGGTSDTSPFNKKTQEFELIGEMPKVWNKLMHGFADRFNSAVTGVEQGNAMDTIKAIFSQLGIDKIGDKDVLAANPEDVAKFAKEKLKIDITVNPLRPKDSKGKTPKKEEDDSSDDEE